MDLSRRMTDAFGRTAMRRVFVAMLLATTAMPALAASRHPEDAEADELLLIAIGHGPVVSASANH